MQSPLTVRMVYRHSSGIAAVVLLAWLFAALPSQACTLWGAAGKSVEGGGALIAKNRDWAPDHRQQLSIVKPQEGYASLVLIAVGGADPGTKAGVNEKGLVIVSATAGQVPTVERRQVDHQKGLTRHLLARCASVEDVLKQIDMFRRPVFYLAGDRREIALIEVAPDGSRAVTRADSGGLHHTNHYEAIDSSTLPRKPGASSTKRAARIADLLQNPDRPYTANDFIRFSQDQSAGPDNSIWRTGSTSAKHRTLATWIVSVPFDRGPQLYLKLANPGEAERACRVDVDAVLQQPETGNRDLTDDLCGPETFKDNNPIVQGRQLTQSPGMPFLGRSSH